VDKKSIEWVSDSMNQLLFKILMAYFGVPLICMLILPNIFIIYVQISFYLFLAIIVQFIFKTKNQ